MSFEILIVSYEHESTCLVLSIIGLITLCTAVMTFYTAVMSFEILFPFGLWVFEPDWLLNHSQLV